jgi:hypothetical protein
MVESSSQPDKQRHSVRLCLHFSGDKGSPHVETTDPKLTQGYIQSNSVL